MDGHGHQDTSGESASPRTHLPRPTFAPLIIALGVMFLAFGVLLGWPMLAAGLTLILVGLGRWLYEDVKGF